MLYVGFKYALSIFQVCFKYTLSILHIYFKQALCKLQVCFHKTSFNVCNKETISLPPNGVSLMAHYLFLMWLFPNRYIKSTTLKLYFLNIIRKSIFQEFIVLSSNKQLFNAAGPSKFATKIIKSLLWSNRVLTCIKNKFSTDPVLCLAV